MVLQDRMKRAAANSTVDLKALYSVIRRSAANFCTCIRDVNEWATATACRLEPSLFAPCGEKIAHGEGARGVI
jgi:hypothetical protein